MSYHVESSSKLRTSYIIGFVLSVALVLASYF
ncbi:MAG: hypothetical protein K0Q57_34, partial [Gammaproteobacteria bacterium]|nr:hypothetical protein [Gammaproteobacteria bacterium]